MAFNFSAVSYIIALIADAFLIFFSIFHVIAFDELKTDYKNPIDQCNSLNPVNFILLIKNLTILYFMFSLSCPSMFYMYCLILYFYLLENGFL